MDGGFWSDEYWHGTFGADRQPLNATASPMREDEANGSTGSPLNIRVIDALVTQNAEQRHGTHLVLVYPRLEHRATLHVCGRAGSVSLDEATCYVGGQECIGNFLRHTVRPRHASVLYEQALERLKLNEPSRRHRHLFEAVWLTQNWCRSCLPCAR